MKSLFVIGIMSGTSMDGINITLVKTNGISLTRYTYNQIYNYSSKTLSLLKEVVENEIKDFKNQDKIRELDKLVTLDHYKAITKFINKFNKHPEIVGFHGQTIYHNVKEGISIQLGNPKELANKLKIKVVGHFRDNDIKLGGQGAPLAPIYHRYLMQKCNIPVPSCFINIGGVSNLTYWDGENLIGFDTGPGNGLMDLYMQKNLYKKYDKNGSCAKKGTPDKKIIKKFLNSHFFMTKYPKSLDKNTFKYLFRDIYFKKLKNEDAMSTLLHITSKSIQISIDSLPNKPKSIYVMGGGTNNKFLMKTLNKISQQNFYNVSKINLPTDMIEAELIAFISARTYYNIPSTFPETTGTSIAAIAGQLYSYD